MGSCSETSKYVYEFLANEEGNQISVTMSEVFKISYLPNSPKACTEERGEQLKVAASFPFSELKHTTAHRDVCICTRHFRNLGVLLHQEWTRDNDKLPSVSLLEETAGEKFSRSMFFDKSYKVSCKVICSQRTVLFSRPPQPLSFL